MPVWNGERYIRRALDSLLAQDYGNFELIISDNASTDATLQICTDYAARDSRISVHTHPCNVGALANFKTVLEMAKGKYFMWAADDDYWLPDFVSVLVKELEAHPEAGTAMCAVDRVYEDDTLFDTIRFEKEHNPNSNSYVQMLKGMTSSKKYNLYFYGLFRTKLLKETIDLLYDVPAADRLYLCQFALATHFRYVDRVMYRKTVYVQPYNVRRPEEQFSKIKNKSIFSDMNILFMMGRMFLQSRIIIWYRKFYLPLALWRYGLLLLAVRVLPSVERRVNPNTLNRLKKTKKLFLLD